MPAYQDERGRGSSCGHRGWARVRGWSLARTGHQPPDFEPLVFVGDGVGLGVGGFGGGVIDGFGLGLLDEGVGVGCAVAVALVDGALVDDVAFGVALPAVFLCAWLLELLADGVAPAPAPALVCEPGLGWGDGVVEGAVVVAAA